MANIRLGQLLVDARMLSQQALDEVLAFQKVDGRRLGTLLVERGLVNETQLTQILSHQLSVPWVALLHIEFSRQLLNLVPYEIAEKFCLVPIYVRHVRGQGDTLYVALDDPTNEDPLRECTKFSGLPVRAMIAPPSDIREAIRVCYGIEIEPPYSKAALAKKPSETASVAPPPPPPPPTEAVPPAEAPPPSAAPPTPRSGEPSAPAAAAPPVITESAPTSARRPSTTPPLSKPPPSKPPMSAPPPSISETSTPPPVSDLEPTLQIARPRLPENEGDAPTVEAVEIALPPRKKSDTADHEDSGAPSERAVPSTRRPGKTPRMVALTLLDGTTLTLPARSPKPVAATPETLVAGAEEASSPEPSGEAPAPGALIAALRAASEGASASDILGSDARWETVFAALLSLLVKKRLITEAELIEELRLARLTRP